jgi:hypothetical protein
MMDMEKFAVWLAVPSAVAVLVGGVAFIARRWAYSPRQALRHLPLDVLHNTFVTAIRHDPTSILLGIGGARHEDPSPLTHYLYVLGPAYLETFVDADQLVKAVVVTARTKHPFLVRIGQEQFHLGRDTFASPGLPSVDLRVVSYQRSYGYWEVSLGQSGWLSYKMRAVGCSDVGVHRGWVTDYQFYRANQAREAVELRAQSGNHQYFHADPDYLAQFSAERREQRINCAAVTARGTQMFPELFSLHSDQLMDRDHYRKWRSRSGVTTRVGALTKKLGARR